MTIAAINEQLLRAIGVGVALLDLKTLSLRFCNDTFREWFGEIEVGRPLSDQIEGFETEPVVARLNDEGRYTTEATFRLRRRMMTVAMAFNRALDGDEAIAVLVCQNITRIKELEAMIDSYSMMVERNTREIKREKEQVEKLLLNMMPRAVYDEYRTFGIVTPRRYDPVAVLCFDFVDFIKKVEIHDPSMIVSELNDIYVALDRIGEQFGCVRVRTVGDVYIAIAGMPDAIEDHAQAAANSAVRFLRYMELRNASHEIKWQCRIGIAVGNVVGSVIGGQKYVFDVFGPAAALANRLRYHAKPMSIVASRALAQQLGSEFEVSPAGTVTHGDDQEEETFTVRAELS